MNEAVEVYERANHYLNQGLIRTEPPPECPHGRRTRREWMSDFLPRLGHPERAFGAVHVAGTSGKGSVSVMVAELLRAAGVRAGLHVTPYLQVSTEKLWVDGQYATAEELAQLVDWIRPHAEATRGPRVPMHGMAWVAITLEHFRRQAVDVGVVEVGIGGRCDLTNVLDTRVAVVNSVGLDHLKTLGPTIKEIAAHKAGVIRPGSRAVVLDQGEGLRAARRQAATVGAPLRVVRRGGDFDARRGDDGQQVLDFRGRHLELRGVRLAMTGAFQAENAALALAAVEELGVASSLSDDGARAALGRARLPGRAEVLPPLAPESCPVLVDGAHNSDKLAALNGLLQEMPNNGRIHLVCGALQSHAHHESTSGLNRLASECATVVATEPRVYCKGALPADELATRLGTGGRPEVLLEQDGRRAVRLAAQRARPEDLVVVTGSIYLVGQVRGLWYPDEDVLLRRSSWF